VVQELKVALVQGLVVVHEGLGLGLVLVQLLQEQELIELVCYGCLMNENFHGAYSFRATSKNK
jgi:hypothetical protein